MMELSTRQNIIAEIIDKIHNASFIAMTGHVSPDGDSVASCLALAMSVKKLGKTPVVLMDQVTDRYTFLGGREFIKTECPQKPDLFICLDCGSKDRMGKFEELFDNTSETIVIDHHISNDYYGRLNYVDPKSSSASELTYDVIAAIGNIDAEIAAALYAGIVFDTGGLRFKSSSPDTFRKVANLVELGIPFDEIYAEMMLTRSYSATLLAAKAFSKMKFVEGLPVVYTFITKEEMASFGATRADLEGVSGAMLNTKGAEVAILISEFMENQSKASFRSKKMDVNILASHWGGGGHVNAAGATIKLLPEAAMDEVLSIVSERYRDGV